MQVESLKARTKASLRSCEEIVLTAAKYTKLQQFKFALTLTTADLRALAKMKPEIAEGFSQKVAMGKNPEMREAVQERFRTQVSHLQTRLNAIRAEIGTEGAREALVREPHAAQSFTPVTLSRRVLLSTNQQLNIEDIQTLNKVYSAEQEFLQKTQQATLTALWQEKSGGWDPHAFTGEERVGLLSAVHQKVRR